MKNTITFFALLIYTMSFGQTPELLYDIENSTGDSNPHGFVELNGVIYFAASTSTYGEELWAYNGVTPPTMVIDFNVGPGSADIENLTVFNNLIVYSANNGVDGNEFVTYDGTTFSITGINNSGTGSYPSLFTEYNGKLYFRAFSSTYGSEIWEFDGVNPPTLLHDINPNAGVGSNPFGFTVFNGKLVFSADDGIAGQEFWEYDGTNAPYMLGNLNVTSPGASSFPEDFTELDGYLYFSANDGNAGKELWLYDGSLTPSQLNSINPTAGSFPYNLIVFDNKLLFTADDGNNGYELWETSTATLGNANLVMDINPSGDSNPDPIGILNDTLYFYANDGVNGTEIWKYDGTNAPSLHTDVVPGPSGSYTNNFIKFNDRFYMGIQHQSQGYELYEFNGYDPIVVHDINPGSSSSSPGEFAVVKNALYFSASDGTSGYEPWKICFPSTVTLSETVCDEYTVPSGNYSVTVSGTYMDTLQNFAGCDSVITVNLTVNSVDTSLTVTAGSLTLDTPADNYQWIDCMNLDPVNGETAISFTPSSPGDYAVVVTNNGCVDTSACYNLPTASLLKNQLHFSVYPNPSTGTVFIESNSSVPFDLRIFSLDGKRLKSITGNGNMNINLSDLPKGIYLLNFNSEGKQIITKKLSIL